MKESKALFIGLLVLNVICDLYAIVGSVLNLIYCNSRTIGISIFGYGVTGNGIDIPLYIITAMLIAGTVFLVNKITCSSEPAES